jgi:hypothetical protein
MSRSHRIVAILVLVLTFFAAERARAGSRHWVASGGGAFGNGSNWIPAGVPSAGEDIYIDLAGTYTVQTDGSYSINSLHIGATSGTPALSVLGSHTITASSGVQLSGGKMLVQGTVQSSTLTMSSGTLSANGGRISLSADLIQQGGSTSLNGGRISASRIRFDGGLVSGAGTITGKVINSAQLAPGMSSAALKIQGDFTQNPSGKSVIQIFNPSSGLNSKGMTVSGSAILTGTLQISIVGTPPALGTIIPIGSFDSHLGEFQNVVISPAAGGVLLQPIIDGQSLAAVVLAVPSLSITPSSLALSSRGSDVMTATLSSSLASDTTVTLASSDPSIASVPASVVIRRGATSAAFTVGGAAVGSTTISASVPATVGGATASASVTVQNTPASVVLTASPATLVETAGDGSIASAAIVLQNSGDTAASVTLVSQGDPVRGAFFTLDPSSFTLPPGASQSVTVSSFA